MSIRLTYTTTDGVSNHQPHDCLLNRLFRRRSKTTSELHVTGLCAGNSPVTGEFPAQMASNAENVSICWRHHVSSRLMIIVDLYSWKIFEIPSFAFPEVYILIVWPILSLASVALRFATNKQAHVMRVCLVRMLFIFIKIQNLEFLVKV